MKGLYSNFLSIIKSLENICMSLAFQVNKITLSLTLASPPPHILYSLEQRNLTLETEMMSLHDELDQERKKFTMIEIKMRNAERAKEDAEKRNDMLQKEMEQFFSTFGELTVEPRRTERGNTIWIQWACFRLLSLMALARTPGILVVWLRTRWLVTWMYRSLTGEGISFTDIKHPYLQCVPKLYHAP